MLPFSHELFPVLMTPVPEERWLTSMHVVRRDGSVRSGGDAVIELMRLSPRTLLVGAVAGAVPPIRHRIRASYDRLAARRGELGQRVPDADPVVDPPRLLRPLS